MTKMKNVWNHILRLIQCVRTHPEELLAHFVGFALFLTSQGGEAVLGRNTSTNRKRPDENSVIDHVCKNSSRITHLKKVKHECFRLIHDEWVA